MFSAAEFEACKHYSCLNVASGTHHNRGVFAGVYNEEVFASLDWVLDEAAKRDLKIILPIEVGLLSSSLLLSSFIFFCLPCY